MAALALADRPTAAALARQGVVLTIVSEGLTAPRVDVKAPAHLAPVVREAIQSRMAAMRAQWEARGRLGGVQATLVAVPGLTPSRGLCLSCGEPHATTHEGGDCAFCNAARVGVLRSVGALPSAEPLPARVTTGFAEWVSLAPFSTGAVPEPTPMPPWTCIDCGRTVEGYRPADGQCGPCELHAVKVRLGQAFGPRVPGRAP